MVFRWFKPHRGPRPGDVTSSEFQHTYDAPSSSQQLEHPLPLTRQRALTLEDRANPQYQSTFIIRIPPEIRALVYEYVLGHDLLHLEPADGILKYSRCFDPDPEDKLDFRHECWKVSWSKEEKAKLGWSLLEPHEDEHILSLLLTCHLVYMEAVDVLYTCNTFSMRRAKSLSLLPKVILPHRLHRIRAIHFSTAFECPLRTDFVQAYRRFPPDHLPHWFGACQTLACMKGLTKLKITLAVWGLHPEDKASVDEESLYILLEPLKSIKVDSFNVIVTAEISNALQARLEPIPFVLSKRNRPGIGKRAGHSDD